MLRLTSGILAVAVVAFVATAAMAAKADAKPKKTPEQRFARLDKNGDEKLSLEEFVGKKTDEMKEKATKRFGKLDKNGDKSLSLEEFKAGLKKKKK